MAIQRYQYKATTELYGLFRQVVVHNRDNAHDFKAEFSQGNEEIDGV